MCTREEVSNRSLQALTGSPKHLHLFGAHSASFVLIVQAAEEETIIAHLKPQIGKTSSANYLQTY